MSACAAMPALPPVRNSRAFWARHWARKNREQVHAALGDGALTLGELLQACSLKRSKLCTALDQLRIAGEVDRGEDGKWRRIK